MVHELGEHLVRARVGVRVGVRGRVRVGVRGTVRADELGVHLRLVPEELEPLVDGHAKSPKQVDRHHDSQLLPLVRLGLGLGLRSGIESG